MHSLSTYFNQREIDKIEIHMDDAVNADFPPKKSNYQVYIYKHINSNQIDCCIKYFKDPNTKKANNQYLIGLAELCRSIITVPNIWKFYFTQCEDSHILSLPEYIKDQTSLLYYNIRYSIFPDEDENVKNPIDPQIRKIALMANYYHYWSDFSKMIRKHYSEGIFHHFNFEEAIFFIYYSIAAPPLIIFSKRKYQKIIDSYIDCLAAAIKTFMEKFHYMSDQTSSAQNNENSNLSEKIFLNFLDFYETQLKLNENTCKYYQ